MGISLKGHELTERQKLVLAIKRAEADARAVKEAIALMRTTTQAETTAKVQAAVDALMAYDAAHGSNADG